MSDEQTSEITAPEFGPGHAYRPRPNPAVRLAAIGNTGRLLVALNDALEAEKVEVQRLRNENAKLIAALVHYEGWFGTECPCDDDECALNGWAQ